MKNKKFIFINILMLLILVSVILVSAEYSTSLETFDSESDDETAFQSNDLKVYANEWTTFYANYTSSDGYDLGQVLWRTLTDFGTTYSVRAIDLIGVGNRTGLVLSANDNMTAFYSNGTVDWSVSNSAFDYAYGMAAADFNNDSREEVAFVTSYGRFFVLNGTNGDVIFRNNSNYGTGYALATGDVDADGREDDIVFSTSNVSATNGIAVYIFNETSGNFSVIWSATTGSLNIINEIDISEIPGEQSLIGIADDVGGRATVYYGNGTLKWQTADLGTAYSIEFFDQDSDGKEDEVAMGESDELRAFMDNGTSLYSKTEPWGGEYEVEKIDLDGDRKYDDMLVSSNYNTVQAFNQDGTLVWTFNAPHKAFESVYYESYFRNIRVGDLNNDSKDEIIAAGYGSRYWILNLSGNIIGKHYYGFEENEEYSEYIGLTTSESNGIDIMNDTNGDGILEIASSRISGYAYIGQQVLCKITLNGEQNYMYYNYTSKLWEYYHFFNESNFNRTSDYNKNFSWNVTCEKGGYQTQTSSAKNITVYLKNSSLDSFDEEDDSENKAGWISERIIIANESTYFFANYTDLEDNISLREIGFKTKYYNDLGDYMYDVNAFDYDRDGKKDSFAFSQYYGISAYKFNGDYEWSSLEALTYGYLYNLRTGDFNNDSVDEIAASSSNGYLIIFNSSNGDELFQSSAYGSCYALESGDINDDNIEDLAIGCSSILENYGILVFSYNFTTSQFENIWSATDATGAVSEIKISELNDTENLVGFVDYTGQEKAYIYYGNGTKAFESPDLGTTVATLEFVDYWQDGTEDDFIIGEDGETFVYFLNGTNFTHTNATNVVFEIEKIDYYGDGYADDYVFFERYALKLNNKTGNEMWNYTFRDFYYGTLEVLDINEDENKEIIFGGYDGIIYIFNKTGSLIYRANLIFPGDLSGEESIRLHANYYGHGTGLEVYKELNEPIYLGFAGYSSYAGVLEMYPKCMIYFNDSTSARMNYNSSSELYYYNRSFSSKETYSWNITCESLSHITRSSGTKKISINSAPGFVSVLNSPSSLDDLDLNINVTITANISDINENFDSAILQWKNSSSDWQNITMQNQTSKGLYTLLNASLTLPGYEDNITYRIIINDSLNETTYSSNYTLSSYWDCTWNISSSLSTATGWETDGNKLIGNIIVNNTGDSSFANNNCSLSIHFTHNLDTGRIYFDDWISNQWYNYYDIIGLEAKSNQTIRINATFLSEVKEESLIITIAESGGISSISSKNSTVTLISILGGPYLYKNIETAPTSLYLTEQNFSLSAYLRNIVGNDSEANTAYNVSFNWSLPSGFLISDGNSSLSYNNLSNNSLVYSDLNISFNSTNLPNLVSGSHNFTIFLRGYNSSGSPIIHAGNITILREDSSLSLFCYNISDSICVTSCGYSQDPDCSASSTATTSSSGGGGGGSAVAVKQEKSEDSFELLRGKNQEFKLRIKNKGRNTRKNIKISVSGINLDYIKIIPEEISRIDSNSSKEVIVKITAPAYFTQGEYTLMFLIQGDIMGNTTEAFAETKKVTLYILEATREETNKMMNESYKMIEEMNKSNMIIKDVSAFLEEAKEYYREVDFLKVKINYNNIKEIYDAAFKGKKIIAELNQRIEEAERNGIEIIETKKVFYIAESIFNRGDYLLAIKRLEESKLAFALETKGEFNTLYIIKNNPYQTLGVILAISILGFGTSLGIRYKIYKKKVNFLNEEEKLLLQLMKVVQTECFEKNKMSMEEYEEAMNQYEKKLSDTVEEKVRIQAKISNLLKIKGKKNALTDEKKRLIELIKDVQDRYLNKGTIETRIYENMLKSYSSKLSEVESRLTFLDAKEALKSNKFFRRFFRRNKNEK